MQVQPLVPLRSTVIAPLVSTVTIVALEEMAAGAAASALAIGSLFCAVTAEAVSANIAAPASRIGKDDVMNPSFAQKGRTPPVTYFGFGAHELGARLI